MTTATRSSSVGHGPVRRGLAAAGVLALLGGGVVACSSLGSDSGGTSAAADSRQLDLAPEAAPRAAGAPSVTNGITARNAAQSGASDTSTVLDQPADEQKLISNGDVSLTSDDVGRAIFDVQHVADRYRGTVEQQSTETDDKGKPLRSRMVLRIPTADFPDAVTDLGKVATLVESNSSTKDVTTTVLDNTVRVDIAKRSIARISVLLDHATSIRDVIRVESELSQRQASLASLERQQRYLADQTAMSTITVSIQRPVKEVSPPPKKTHHHGFASGLQAGWDALARFGTGLATVAGALLPWAVVAAILAVPGWPIYRRLRRRPPTEGSAAPSGA